MIKPIILNEYYLSPNEVKAIAETTLALYASNMLRKRNMISESEHKRVLDECARHLTPILTEGNTRESRKRIYTANQMREALTRHFDQMMNEGVGDWLSNTWNGIKNFGSKTVDKLEDWGMYKRGDSFGRNLARGFGFDPDEGLSWGNVLNGAITLGSLVAAPFSGGGSLAGGAALRTALATGGRAAAKALLTNLGKNAAKNFATGAARRAVGKTALTNLGKNLAITHGINAGMGMLGLGGSDGSAENSGQQQYANMATNSGTQNYYRGYGGQNYFGGYNPYSGGYNPYGGGYNPYSGGYGGYYGGMG